MLWTFSRQHIESGHFTILPVLPVVKKPKAEISEKVEMTSLVHQSRDLAQILADSESEITSFTLGVPNAATNEVGNLIIRQQNAMKTEKVSQEVSCGLPKPMYSNLENQVNFEAVIPNKEILESGEVKKSDAKIISDSATEYMTESGWPSHMVSDTTDSVTTIQATPAKAGKISMDEPPSSEIAEKITEKSEKSTTVEKSGTSDTVKAAAEDKFPFRRIFDDAHLDENGDPVMIPDFSITFPFVHGKLSARLPAIVVNQYLRANKSKKGGKVNLFNAMTKKEEPKFCPYQNPESGVVCLAMTDDIYCEEHRNDKLADQVNQLQLQESKELLNNANKGKLPSFSVLFGRVAWILPKPKVQN